jgi:hypothetical protein
MINMGIVAALSWAASIVSAQVPTGPQAGPPPPAPDAASPSDIEPAVNTSAPTSSAAAAPSAAAPRRKASQTPGATRRPGRAPMDRVDLDVSQFTGNRELPKVLYIVPWKRPELGDLMGRPINSLLDEVLAPVDRDVFRRENRYFESLQNDARAPAAKPTPGGAAMAPTPAGPEK